MNWKFLISSFILLKSHLFLNAVDSTSKDLNPAVFLRYLDVNALSRLYAFKQYIAGVKYDLRPVFRNGWLYHTKLLDKLTRRIGMYGYGIASLNSIGDGNCMFYSVITLFHINGITNKHLLELLNPKLEYAVYAAVKGMLENEKPLTALNLKRISQIKWMGVDPNDPDSVSYFNPSGVTRRLRALATFQEGKGAKTMSREDGTIFDGIDMIKYNNRFRKENKLDVLRDLEKELDVKFLDRFGEGMDKDNIEEVFQLNFLVLDRAKTTVQCSRKSEKEIPKLIFPLLYEGGCHFDIAGLFKLGATDPKQIKTMFTVQELPLPLVLLMAEDCRYRPN